MKRRFNFLKALLPFILAIGTFSACNQDSPNSPENVKVIIKNWPENVKTINFAGVEFTKNDINQQKEGCYWVGKSCGLIIDYKGYYSSEEGLYGTIKDNENYNFKVFINGKEYQNEADFLESESMKTNLSMLFSANIKGEAEMELSFEGSPKEINPKDVRLLDETGYSYIYIEDSLAETMNFSFSYADTSLTETSSNINEIFSDYYFSDNKSFLYPIKTDKKIIMNAYPKDGYAMKKSFAFSTDPETIKITADTTHTYEDSFTSNSFSPLSEQGSILTVSGTPAEEIPDVLAGISCYISRIIKEKQSFSGEWTTQLLPPDVKNARISFGTDKSVEILLDKTTITGTYYMTTSGAELDIPGYYNDSLNGYEGYFKLKKDSDTTHYFYLASMSEGGIGEPTIGFYADGEAVATKGDKVPLNVKFVYFDSVPEEVTVYLKGYETDTELGSFTLNGKNSDWAPEVTDTTIELDTSKYEAGEYTLYVKNGEVVSNDLPVIITE